MTKPRILITGGNGQVGSYLHELLTKTYDCATAFSPKHPTAALTIDLTDADDIRKKVQAVAPRVIINAAAYTAVDRAETEPALAHKINAVAPGILAEEAARLSALLIHYSTDYVFAGTGTKAWREDDPPSPVNVYGVSKLAGELAIAAAHDLFFIFRTSWVISPRGQNFVKTMLKLGRERDELNIINDQHGAPTSAQELAELTAAVVDQACHESDAWSRSRAGIYHLANQGETTWHGLADYVFQYARARGVALTVKSVAPIPTSAYPTPARRPSNSRLDCSKFSDTFGLQAKSWQDGVREIVDQLTMNP